MNLPADDELIRLLGERHSIWHDNERTWQEIEDVLFDHVKNNLDRYIPRGEDEEPTDYSQRLRFARFKGELAPLIHRFIGAVMSRPPTRAPGLLQTWGHFIDNCDGCQTSLDQFMEDRLFEAFGFGASVILLDRPIVDDNGMSNETTSMGFTEQSVARKVDPYELIAVPYRINQVVDWSLDRTGEFHWVRLMENQVRSPYPLAPSQEVKVYREFDRSSWRVFEVGTDEHGEEVLLDMSEGDHHLGIVPLSILYLQRDRPMSFYSPMRYAYQYDITNFIVDADLQYAQWRYSYPLVKDMRSEDRGRRVSLGPGSSVKLNPDRGEDIRFEEIGGSGLNQLRQTKSESVEGLRRLSGIDALASNINAQAYVASGRSRAISFSISEERHLRRASKALQSCERRLFEIAERWVSSRQDIHPSEQLNQSDVTYPMVFTNTGTDALIEQWLGTRNGINSEEYDRQMQSKIIDAALGDVGSETRGVIREQIEANPLMGKTPGMEGAPAEEDFDMGAIFGKPDDSPPQRKSGPPRRDGRDRRTDDDKSDALKQALKDAEQVSTKAAQQ